MGCGCLIGMIGIALIALAFAMNYIAILGGH